MQNILEGSNPHSAALNHALFGGFGRSRRSYMTDGHGWTLALQ